MPEMDGRLTFSSRNTLSRRVWTFLLLLVALSFAIRTHDLGAKSLWSDEGLTLRRAEQSLGLIFENVNLIPVDPDYQDGSTRGSFVRTPDLHPPLYFLLMHVWLPLAGRSEFALRFPSVFAATLSVALLYVVGGALFNRETGLWAALMGAASPFFLWYAQEARMYTWLVVLSLTSMYFFLPLLEKGARRKDYAAYVVTTLALLYTHYAGFLLLAFELGVYGLHRVRRQRREPLVILAALIIAVLPLVPFLWRLLGVHPFSFTYRPLGIILKEAWSSFSLGPTRSAIQPWWRLLPFLSLFGVGILVAGVETRRRGWVVGLGYLAIPVLLQYALSLIKPNYMNPRHLMVVAPAFELMLAQGLTTLRRWFSPSLVLALGLVLVLRVSASYDILTSHQFWKDDIRGAVQYIEERARPGDAIILHHPVIRLTFDYYYDGPYPEVAIPRYGNNRDTARAQASFEAWARRYERIWFMYGPPPTYFPHDFLPDWAEANLFKVCQQEFEAWWTYVGVAGYEHHPPTLETIPTGVDARDERWGGLHLVGIRPQGTAAGKEAWVDLYWQVGEDPPEEPLTLKAQLLDSAGTVWHERRSDVLPFYPPAAWPTDDIVRVEFRLPLPEDLPPISYTLSLEPVGLGESRQVGQLGVDPPTSQDGAARPMAHFEGNLELLDAKLESDTFRAGYPLTGNLTWRASATPKDDYALRIRILDPQRGVVTSRETPLSAAEYPTSRWTPGDPVAGRLIMQLPAELKSGSHQVQISLIEQRDGSVVPVKHWYGERDWLTLGSVQIDVWPMVTRMPEDVDHTMGDNTLAEKVHLRGYDLEREDSALNLSLYWQADDSLDENYHVFVHVGEAEEPPLAEAGGLPVDWTRPTTSWRAGEVIADTHVVSLSDVPPGTYDLLIGFFDPETGQRPQTTVDGKVVPGGYVLLEEVRVE